MAPAATRPVGGEKWCKQPTYRLQGPDTLPQWAVGRLERRATFTDVGKCPDI